MLLHHARKRVALAREDAFDDQAILCGRGARRGMPVTKSAVRRRSRRLLHATYSAPRWRAATRPRQGPREREPVLPGPATTPRCCARFSTRCSSATLAAVVRPRTCASGRAAISDIVSDEDVTDVLRRRVRTAACEKTFRVFSRAPYRAHLEWVPPRVLVPLEAASLFLCGPTTLRRDPRDTKGQDYRVTTEAAPVCSKLDGGGSEACC